MPKFATHLVYLTKAGSHKQIEKRIMESIFSNTTKRADIYWFLNIGRSDDPYTMEYSVEPILNEKIMRIDFRLGFRIQPKIGIMFRKVVEEMLNNQEIDLDNRLPSLNVRPRMISALLSWKGSFLMTMNLHSGKDLF